jgi:hypothetical protein
MTALSHPADDRAAYARGLIAHRAPELTDRDLAALMEPDLPAEIAAQVLDVLEALEQRMDELAAIVRDHDDGDHDRRRARQAGEAILSAVDECRRALIDLTIEDKVIAMERLSAWVELERSTSEQQH